MTLPTAERLFWHCGEHTAKPESAYRYRFLILPNSAVFCGLHVVLFTIGQLRRQERGTHDEPGIV